MGCQVALCEFIHSTADGIHISAKLLYRKLHGVSQRYQLFYRAWAVEYKIQMSLRQLRCLAGDVLQHSGDLSVEKPVDISDAMYSECHTYEAYDAARYQQYDEL